jgi:hypothetical protein
MASIDNATVTYKGIALDAKLLASDTTHFTRAAIGSGSVPITNLKEQTTISGYIMDIDIVDLVVRDTGVTFYLNVSNLNLESNISIRQIGLFAEDPDDGEILYFVAQSNEAITLVTGTGNTKGNGLEFVFDLDYSTSENYTAEINPAGLLTKGVADLRYMPFVDYGGEKWHFGRDDNGIYLSNGDVP